MEKKSLERNDNGEEKIPSENAEIDSFKLLAKKIVNVTKQEIKMREDEYNASKRGRLL